MRYSLRSSSGFTLVEILFTVLILSVLLAISIPLFYSWKMEGRAKQTAVQLDHDSTKLNSWMQQDRRGVNGYLSGGTLQRIYPGVSVRYTSTNGSGEQSGFSGRLADEELAIASFNSASQSGSSSSSSSSPPAGSSPQLWQFLLSTYMGETGQTTQGNLLANGAVLQTETLANLSPVGSALVGTSVLDSQGNILKLKGDAKASTHKVSLCHLAGPGHYNLITVDAHAADSQGGGHGAHAGDIIPAPATGCPGENVPPPPIAPSSQAGLPGVSASQQVGASVRSDGICVTSGTAADAVVTTVQAQLALLLGNCSNRPLVSTPAASSQPGGNAGSGTVWIRRCVEKYFRDGSDLCGVMDMSAFAGRTSNPVRRWMCVGVCSRVASGEGYVTSELKSDSQWPRTPER